MKHIETVYKNFETVKEYLDFYKIINRVLSAIPEY
jgi:hypothetical protein